MFACFEGVGEMRDSEDSEGEGVYCIRRVLRVKAKILIL